VGGFGYEETETKEAFSLPDNLNGEGGMGSSYTLPPIRLSASMNVGKWTF
jgi:hypothetical protein